MRLINSIVILCNLYTNVICDFYTDLSGEALYSQIGLRNIRETITYPRTDTSYKVEILQPPSEKDFWKSYLDNTLQTTNTESYIRPIRADYKAQITYLKPVINTRPNPLPIPQKIHWQTINPVVIKPPIPPQKTKLEVVKFNKAPLVETLNLEKFFHHRKPIPSMMEPHLQGIMPKKVPEVVVNVNLGYKRNQLKKDLSTSSVSNPIKIDQNKYHINTENKVKMLGKPIIGTTIVKKVPSEKHAMKPASPRPSRPQIKEFQTNQRKEEVEEEQEQHEVINPHHLLKSGKMKLKETKLSEHDSIVEVIMPQKQLKKAAAASTGPSPSSTSSSSDSFESSSESGEQEDNVNEKSKSSSSSTCQICKCGKSKKNDEDGNSSAEAASTCNCAQRGPPIIKNRFVVLHLKEKMIRDPLIKFLAQV